jgi:uncharacterized protein (DUF2147 family)
MLARLAREEEPNMNLTARLGAIAAVLVGTILGSAPAAAQAIVEGTWRSANGSEILIAPCAAGYCGTLTKPSVSAHDISKYGDSETAMKSFLDEHNEEASLRSRPLLGLELLNVKGTGNPWYYEGQVYNPSDGKTYSGAITVVGADTMQLKGCALYVFCKEEQWSRVVD